MKCVSYIRYSSCFPEADTPQDVLKQQSERIQKFIKAQEWEQVGKYADRRKSSEAEDAFREMLEDGMARKFEMIVTDSVFRCGRNVSFAEDVLLKTFYPAGIHFCVLEDNICSLSMTMEQLTEYFRKKRNILFGGEMTARSRKKQVAGYYTVHDEKYGYLLTEDRKSFVVDEEAATIIREIFYLLGEKGMTYKDVADVMNEKGYESPMAHLARVGLKRRVGIESKWVPNAITRIAENTAYIGYWYKMIAGERTEVSIQSIIDKELFEKVRARYAASPNRNIPNVKKSENVFIKHICDKETGEALMCRLHKEAVPFQTFAIGFWDKERIAYDEVMKQTVQLLQQEKQYAQIAKKYISSEVGKQEFQLRKESLAELARKLFSEMSAIEEEHIPMYCKMQKGEISETVYQNCRSEIMEKLQEKESEFAGIMEMLDKLETAFSNRNPWVQTYSKINVPDELNKAQVRKWIDKVLISNMKIVELAIPEKLQCWRELLPELWFEG